MLAVAPQELRDTYLAFRRDRRHDDGLGPRAKNFPSFDEPTFGLNPDLSRLVRAADGTTAHLVPGDGVLAIIEHTGGAFCALNQALGGTTVGTSFRGTGRLRVWGLVPDGVGEVTVMRRNGDPIVVPVSDHLYAVEVHATVPDELPAEVRFILRGRERRLAVPGADDEVLHIGPPPQ